LPAQSNTLSMISLTTSVAAATGTSQAMPARRKPRRE
jgi:hypothetical protein